MKLIGYYRNHKLAVAIVFVLLIVQAFSDLALPTLTAQIVDVGLSQYGVESAEELAAYQAAGVDLHETQVSFLLSTGAEMLALAALGMMMSICIGLVASRTGAKIGFELRFKLFSQVVSFSEGEISRFSAASLITRGTNDIQMIQNITTMLLRMALSAPILAVGGIIMVMATNAQMGWIIVVAVACVFCVIGVVFKVAIPKFKIMQRLIDRVNLVAREMLTGMPVIRAFDRQPREEERFDEASTRLMRTQLFTNRVMTFMMPTMNLIMNVTSVAVVWIGGIYIDNGSLQTGDLIAFITYAMMIIMSFLMLGMVSIMLPRAEVAAERVNEVISTQPAICDPAPVEGGAAGDPAPTGAATVEGATAGAGVPAGSVADPEAAANGGASSNATGGLSPTGTVGARIEFKDVSFAYEGSDECVLKDVSFAVEPGQTLAIIGSTGSGKSTMIKLMLRFYDPTKGVITLDGVDIRDIPLHELRAQFGYAPQKAFLFSGTIESNVAYSDESMGDDRVERALAIAQALEFANSQELGVDSDIAQGGTNVSGGQRQRLSMARAFAKDARALLLDDSFSALDYKTDAALRHAMAAQLGGVTQVVVAQRISTIMGADRIIVLDDGCVVGDGVHDDLMRGCVEYGEIAHSQLSSLELGEGDAS